MVLRLILKKSDKKEKVFALFLTAAFLSSAVMVLIVRPNDSNIPNFDFKHVGMSFYFYCLLLTLGSSLLVKFKKESAPRIIIPIIIVIFAIQQPFSFFAFRLQEEARARKTVVENMGHELIGELSKLSKDKSSTLSIPNLDGQYIYQPAQGYSLADYLPFFNNKIPLQLVRNSAMNQYQKYHEVPEVISLRDATSLSFIETLKTSSILKSYYASRVMMKYSTNTMQNDGKQYLVASYSGTTTIISKNPIDPEKRHIVSIDFLTDNTPGNAEIYFSFENDFGVSGVMGQIKIDDYSPYILVNSKRNYNITADMLQLYTYSLSKKVENIVLWSSPKKNMHINKVYFE